MEGIRCERMTQDFYEDCVTKDFEKKEFQEADRRLLFLGVVFNWSTANEKRTLIASDIGAKVTFLLSWGVILGSWYIENESSTYWKEEKHSLR